MPSFGKLSDAAIAICEALDELGVDFGIFGGYAIAVLGGRRESKDIDCVVNCDKEWLVRQLSRVEGFQSMGNTRPDLAQFVFGNSHVLLELFPMSTANALSHRVQVAGEKAGSSTTKILDVVLLFKGKLQAAATRAKYSDAADLLWLEGQYNALLKRRKAEFHQAYAGMVMLRYPHLEHAFERLDLDIDACKALVRGANPDANQPPPQIGQVQSGLVYGM